MPVTGGGLASWVAGQVFSRIANFSAERRLGWVFPPGTPFGCFPKHRDLVRKPDVAFVSYGKFPHEILPQGSSTVVPELVVEVVAAADDAGALRRRVTEFQKAGVGVIWEIHPGTRSAYVWRANAKTELTCLCGDGEVLDGEPAVFGLRVRLGDLWRAGIPTGSTK